MATHPVLMCLYHQQVTALIVLILGVIIIAVLLTAGGHSETRLQQLQDSSVRGLNVTALAHEQPAQSVAFCNATGDCASNRCDS